MRRLSRDLGQFLAPSVRASAGVGRAVGVLDRADGGRVSVREDAQARREVGAVAGDGAGARGPEQLDGRRPVLRRRRHHRRRLLAGPPVHAALNSS